MREFAVFGDEHGVPDRVQIGDEVSETNLSNYDVYLHSQVFTGAQHDEIFHAENVETIVMDGNQKVHAKLVCGVDEIPKHTGPKRKGKEKPYENGHVFGIDPDGYIRGVLGMFHPEDTDIVIELMKKMIPYYPKWIRAIMDRICKVAPTTEKMDMFKQIICVVLVLVDKHHAAKHSAKCKYNPWNHQHFMDQSKSINDSVCEQTFAWLSRYARTLNELRNARHHLLVLYYSRRHNECIAQKKTTYLNAFTVPRSRCWLLSRAS